MEAMMDTTEELTYLRQRVRELEIELIDYKNIEVTDEEAEEAIKAYLDHIKEKGEKTFGIVEMHFTLRLPVDQINRVLDIMREKKRLKNEI